ncbi:MAG: class I SAM-dependent methyltransferase [Planctomycetes bacterium]|jgi:SAM-dependent methyltransferase|nr:class I SAM-dependent methyltransferase [Planctomycetota bacterium]
MRAEQEQKLLNLVKQNYNSCAQEFCSTRKKMVWPKLKSIVDELINNQPEQTKFILDAGCGNGRLIPILPSNCYYYGIDVSANLLSLAEKNVIEWRSQVPLPQKITFRAGSLVNKSELPLDISFDLIFCIAVIHHLPGKSLRLQALNNLKLLLKTNGHLVISFWNFFSLNNLFKKRGLLLVLKFALLKLLGKNNFDFGDLFFNWGNKNKVSPDSLRYYHAFTLRGFCRLAREANFKIEKIEKDSYNYYITLKN